MTPQVNSWSSSWRPFRALARSFKPADLRSGTWRAGIGARRRDGPDSDGFDAETGSLRPEEIDGGKCRDLMARSLS